MALQFSSNNSDQDLINGIVNGSDEAFNIIVERYAPLVFNIAHKITGSRQDAEDIVQETFIIVYKSIGKYSESKASFKTWLLTITRNQSINTFSSIKRRTSRFLTTALGDPQENIPIEQSFSSNNPGPEISLIEKQRLKALNDHLDSLPENQRTALILKAWEGLSYQEIGSIMNLSVSSVESLIFRARKKLIGLRD